MEKTKKKKQVSKQELKITIRVFDDDTKQCEITPKGISDLELIGLGEFIKNHGYSELGKRRV